MTDIRVLNCSGLPHKDRFNGKDYEFPVNEAVVVPVGAAQHIFGMGLQDRSKQIVRLGWAPTSAQWLEAMERLDGFVFELVVDEDALDEPIARPVAAMEQPTEASLDPDLVTLKARTRSIMEKAA